MGNITCLENTMLPYTSNVLFCRFQISKDYFKIYDIIKIIIALILVIYPPVQVTPSQSFRQVQLAMPLTTLHDPSFLQGFAVHGETGSRISG